MQNEIRASRRKFDLIWNPKSRWIREAHGQFREIREHPGCDSLRGTVFLDRTSQHYLAPYFAPEFHLSQQQAGMLGSVVAVTWAVSTLFFFALFFRRLSDRIGRKPVLLLMAAMSAIVPLALLISPLFTVPWALVGLYWRRAGHCEAGRESELTIRMRSA